MTVETTAPVAPELARTASSVRGVLLDLDRPCWVIRDSIGIGLTSLESVAGSREVLAAVGPLSPQSLGDSRFTAFHGIGYAYAAGAMANGISSPDLVTAMARAGYLATYGAAGIVASKIDSALAALSANLGDTPFACNLIHSPTEPALERAIVDACLRHGVRCVEASAFMGLSHEVVRYRLSGLSLDAAGRTVRGHRLIAKVSRVEVAELFLRPAPRAIVAALVARGDVTADQARWSEQIPMADDITAEADSGGHTDRRPMTVLFPELVSARDRVHRELPALGEVRIGAAGGIGTPAAAAAAFAMGAAYVVTGSINQATVEADQSVATKALLATAGVADCTMAPSSDMFELGVQVQVLRRGTMFAARAQRLYEMYREYDGLDSIPPRDRVELESTIMGRELDSIWNECTSYFGERDPAQLRGAEADPKRKMALVFRWYLGLSSGWSIRGDAERVTDYQIWCGPAIGAFNGWTAGTALADPAGRRVADVAQHMMIGAAYLTRIAQLRAAGVRLPSEATHYIPARAGRS
ncbi:trans-AT polyketide synthase/acyltransferase/oxidoreductase domain-containing protein [Rhodococcus sp. 27YEA15]|uniref:PfaD family polyunsaturated fatty acid/polyketide biosynthesis protein n=1 Tax=Rhodococcus sp. 27YEA15 TaxID=3156259 RepID=UPI003C7C0B40